MVKTIAFRTIIRYLTPEQKIKKLKMKDLFEKKKKKKQTKRMIRKCL